MRFTKVPLIAILAAGALSLLAVLPALAQNDTRGQVGGSNFQIRVLKEVGDATVADVVAPAYFNGVLYVSNSAGVERTVADNADAVADLDAVANVVRVTISTGSSVELVSNDMGTLDEMDDEKTSCYEVTVENRRSGDKIKAYAPIVDDGSTTDFDERFATFEVIPYGQENTPNRSCWPDAGNTPTPDDQDLLLNTAAEARKAIAQIAARDGDVIRVTAKGAVNSYDLTVDGEGPEFDYVAPAHKSYSSSTSARFQFTITDDGAGLRHDGEFTFALGDEDAENVDEDNDGIRGGEPRSVPDDRAGERPGDSADISLNLNGTDQIYLGTNRWRVIATGRSYSMDVPLQLLNDRANTWNLDARDRVGNRTISDADSSKDDDQDYTITVDTGKPTLSLARTGVAFSASKKKEVVDRKSIAVTLRNGDGGVDDDLSAVDHTDFRVAGHAVTGASLIAVKADCDVDQSEREPLDLDGACIESPKARVYLQLATDLDPDETPEVEVLGGAVVDLAGNSNDPGKIEARDRIAPALAVTINPGSEIPGRPVIRKSGQITVRVVSDEELRRRPAVWFATIVNNGERTDADLAIRVVRPGTSITAQSADNTWERVYRANATGLSGLDGLIAVIVTGEDAPGNIGSPDGVSLGDDDMPTAGDGLTLDDLIADALLIEVDDEIAKPTFSLAPYRDSDTTVTESSRPFITIEYAEANEDVYDVEAVEDHDDNSATPDQRVTGVTKVRLSEDGDDIKLDSHEGVRITAVTLDGDDVSGDLAAINSRKYTLTTSGLRTGARSLKITGVDDAGNGRTDTYNFTVAARGDYEVDLTPGWNLVSIPGTPTDSDVASVLDGAPQSKIVLSYQNDEWVTAVRVDDGGWQGTLTDIVGGYGYWIQTTAFETLAASIPETDTSSVLPTARVTAGWNLLGVVDVEQADADDPPSGGADADNYFSNLRWSVAYSYDTRTNDWTRILPKTPSADDAIKNGKGYWVWATAPGTLVP